MLATRTAEETRELGRRLGHAAPSSAVLTLSGPLGAGKTVLAQGVLEGMGVPGPHPSPTFTVIRRYARPGGGWAWHVDAYRLSGPEDLGWDEVLDALVLVEWPAALLELLPADRLEATLERVGAEGRRLEIVATGALARAWLEQAHVPALGSAGAYG